MLWVKQSEDQFMPDWLKSELSDECPECHSPILNGYNDNMECTRRVCSNELCKRTIAARIGEMCKVLGIAGIKEGIGYKIVKDNGLTNYFDAIPIICTEKPDITLSTLFKFAFIFGINDEFEDICKDFTTVDEVLNDYIGKYKSELLQKADLLRYGATKFNIVKPVRHETLFSPVVGGCVVITGEIPKISNRDDFIPIVNATFLGLTNFTYSKTRRKTGLFCCIAEDKAAVTGKVQDAKSAGVPIYTKNEFMSEVISRIKSAGLYDEYIKVFQERSVKG